ncbi:MAG: type II toxin-antitoxin system PrlF family antitoxin [Gemmatimonadota bacterium]|nr:type II toxin-antitoxin system PrlF family antitoxin [Gemmatimonadota bacterium]
MYESSITSKGQTTIPKHVREALGVEAGDRVRYVITDGDVRLLSLRPIGRLFGALQHHGAAVTIEEMERAVSDGAAGE